MKVVHLSTRDLDGGAARAAHRLHRGILSVGLDSRMFVSVVSSSESSVQGMEPSRGMVRRLARRSRRGVMRRSMAPYRRRRLPGLEEFSDDRTEFSSELLEQLPGADVYNLHWISGWVDYRACLGRMTRRAPVVWTLHDMNAFTGGCHYDNGCGRFTRQCGACPQLVSTEETDLSRQIWSRKQEALGKLATNRLHIVTPSRWLAGEAKRSSLLGRFPVSVIPYGLDLDTFAPRDRAASRDLLGLPRDAKVLLFVAHWAENRRKGIALLVQALKELETMRDLVLVSVGHGNPTFDMRLRHLHMGNQGNDHFLSILYGAADLFVIPTQADNLPNTVLEAMACGTPVVGFNVGGVSDAIRPGITGELVPAGDVKALSATLANLLQDGERRAQFSANCRRVALQEYPLELQARRYMELYQSLLHTESSQPSATVVAAHH